MSSRVEHLLPPRPASAGTARRLVAEALERWSLGELLEDATLCVSELVTNAVLHSGTSVGLALERIAGGVRVEVSDGSSELPVPVPASGTAADITAEGLTGRGLRVVAMCAARHGVEEREGGKTVWFELGTAAGAEDPGFARRSDPLGEPVRGAGARTVVLSLRSMPVRAAVASGRHVDDLVRELQLDMAGAAPGDARALAERLRAVLDASAPARLAGRRAALAASERGERRYGLELEVPVDVLAGVTELNALLTGASAGAGRRHLLPTAEVRAFRDWIEAEALRQLGGAAPAPCPLPD